jgi:FdhE protein
MSPWSWDARIARAENLAAKLPFAAEILKFYSAVARLQKDMAAKFAATCGRWPRRNLGEPLRTGFDPASATPQFPRFLSTVAAVAPAALADFARELAAKPALEQEQLLTSYWENGCRAESPLDESSSFCARAFLLPYAAFLADSSETPPTSFAPGTCPLCEGLPQLGVLRPEGDGGRRSLLCSFCLAEWDYRRILCPSCGEEDEKKLCVYVAKEIDHLRVEACDSCRNYTISVDLTKDGRAVPLVDELAALPLSLWADEQGYRKLQPNLLGM